MNRFTKNDTMILKGVAILFLFLHHGWQSTEVTFFVSGIDLVSNLQSFAKICVAIFVILSGYGLYCSYERQQISNIKQTIQFVSVHIIKIFLTFWLVFILAALFIGTITGNFQTVYAGHPFYYVLMDGMGISYFTVSPKFVNSWWYISATLLYYVCFPILYAVIKKLKRLNWILLPLFTVILLLNDGINTVIIYFAFFVFGMIFAERKIFSEQAAAKRSRTQKLYIRIPVYIALFLLVTIIRQIYLDEMLSYYVLDWILVLVMMMFLADMRVENMAVLKPLIFLGKYSFEMFLIHAVFIRYFVGFIYYTENLLGIFIRVTVISVLAAMGIVLIKKIIHFQQMYQFCCQPNHCKKIFAGIAIVIFLLFIPEVIANIGFGNLELKETEVYMEEEKYRQIEYSQTPVFWDFANKKYTSDNSQIAVCANDFIFSHQKGSTEVTISIPGGKKVNLIVNVE